MDYLKFLPESLQAAICIGMLCIGCIAMFDIHTRERDYHDSE